MSSLISPSCLSPDLQQHRYLTEKEVSALTGRALQTLRNDRSKGKGFPYIKFGRSVRYRLPDILAAMDSRLIETEAL
jgi:predicted DNA-binding transcriptional regulator AlpA